jgi:hypothetical protein
MSEPVHTLVADVLADDDPWLFRKHAHTYQAIKDHLQQRLAVADMSCLVVGSAKYGFSISPDRFGRPFTSESDIDIALVSPTLFDELWDALLDWRYPWHTTKWHPAERRWALFHMEDQLAGYIDPRKIKVPILGVPRIPQPIRHRALQWFDAFKLAEHIGPARGHSVQGRIYRSSGHLRHYTAWGLQAVKTRKENNQ